MSASYWDWLPVELQDKIREYASLLQCQTETERHLVKYQAQLEELRRACDRNKDRLPYIAKYWNCFGRVRCMRRKLVDIHMKKASFTFAGF